MRAASDALVSRRAWYARPPSRLVSEIATWGLPDGGRQSRLGCGVSEPPLKGAAVGAEP